MLTITAIKAFNDNYIWVLQQQPHTQVYVVDPGDASVVIDYLEANQLTLAGILLTHHHNDHTGGVAELQAYSQNRLTVYGPDNEKIEGITHPLHATAQPRFTLDYISGELQVLDVPGHTAGHIAYVAVAAAAYLKVRQRKCSTHYSNLPSFPHTLRCIVPMSTHFQTSNLPSRSTPTIARCKTITNAP